MRSYESKKKCRAFVFLNNDLFPTYNLDFYTNDQTPDCHLLREIRENPESVAFLPPFIKSFIIKVGDYQNRYKSLWKDSWLLPGDSSVKVQTTRYFSVAQYTYQTLKQYLQWKRAEVKLIGLFGYSFELFFSRNQLLNFKELIAVVDSMISEGVMNPLSFFKINKLDRVHIASALKNHEHLDKMRLYLVKKAKSDVYENYQGNDVDEDG